MASRFPRATYVPALIAPVMHLAAFVTHEYFTNTGWWTQWTQTWQIGSVWLLAAAYTAGLLVHDMRSSNSWIWENWKRCTRKFVVMGLYVKHPVADPKRLEVNVHIKFVRRVRMATLLLRVHSCTGLKRGPPPPFIHIIEVEKLSNVMKDEQRTIKLVTRIIPYPGHTPFHSIWGNSPLSIHATAPSLVAGSNNVVYLELVGPWVTWQSHKFFVADIDYAAPNPMPAIYAQDEDDDVFNVSKRP